MADVTQEDWAAAEKWGMPDEDHKALAEDFARHRTTALAAKEAELAECAPYLKPGQTIAERMKQDNEEILGLMKLLEKTKWALQDAVSTNVENCRQRDWWRHAHDEVQAELAAEREKVEKLRAALTVFVKCARYQPHMGGNHSFMGWNQSDLRRAESHARATLAALTKEPDA